MTCTPIATGKIDKSHYGYYPCIKCGKVGLRFKNNPCSKCKRKK